MATQEDPEHTSSHRHTESIPIPGSISSQKDLKISLTTPSQDKRATWRWVGQAEMGISNYKISSFVL